MSLSGFLKEDAAVTIVIGPFVNDTTPGTEEAGLTITASEVFLSKNGGAFAAKNESTAPAAMTNAPGSYSCLLNATDTSTPGILRIQVTETGTLVWWAEYMVMAAQAWDSLFGTDLLQVHAAEISAGLITSEAIATGAIDADALAADAITAAKVASDVSAEIADAVWDEDIDAAHQTANSAGKRLDDASTTVSTNLNATVSSRSTFDDTTDTVIVNMTTTLPGSPTVDTVGDALKRGSVGIPLSEAGATGGLATFDNVMAGAISGSVDDTTPAAGGFTANAGLNSLPDLTGSWLFFTTNGLMARKITLDDEGSPKTLTFTGSAGDADAPFATAPSDGDPFIIFGFHGA